MSQQKLVEKESPIHSIITDLEAGRRSITALEGKGFLHLEPNLPFLMVYRCTTEKDAGTKRLVKSAASYLILDDSTSFDYENLLEGISLKMLARHRAFLIIDVYSGPESSLNFEINAPQDSMPASMEALREELLKINSIASHKKIDIQIHDLSESDQKLSGLPYSKSDIFTSGAVWIGLQVPPVFRNKEGILFPVYFRRFRDRFYRAIQKGIFEFIRVQTPAGIPSYSAIGKRSIHQELFHLDRELTALESSFNLLMLVAPVNINDIRTKFFESGFQQVLDYHYRLLPVDPDRLKRKLFNLRIDEIDDPALSYLYNEKREEVDKQLSMLKERGTRNFFYSSIRLFHGVEKDLKKEAQEILSVLPEQTQPKPEDLLSAHDFKDLVHAEFDYFKAQDPQFKSQIHLKKDLNIMMVSQGEFYLPHNYRMTSTEAQALLQHEIGTHVLTYYNGSQQPLTQMKAGLADYDTLQEGLAVMAEYLCGSLTPNRLRTLAGRVIAGDALIQGCDFKEMFDLLKNTYGFDRDRAFNITSRMFQGGGFLKDIIYLKGFVQLRHYLNSGGDLQILLSGKFALHHINIIKELTERQVLLPAKITPRYLDMDCYRDQLKQINAGTYLAQMTQS
ncbi:flavohemoglobin expression-modulating QEGLA motif protein [Nonlabens xiamenensis]|uniref:flavohemoglobin expression-modulating QEGLA motif protein n=1 Tax=Nonlabens xiamenensis TaxID=2341043 RepID=UPI001F0C01A4|nr:tyrosine/phenylalanine carboxypeptidase domain-containing protein [Nonlabens xiamenensis]